VRYLAIFGEETLAKRKRKLHSHKILFEHYRKKRRTQLSDDTHPSTTMTAPSGTARGSAPSRHWGAACFSDSNGIVEQENRNKELKAKE
jgi:hypothetical protein